MDTKDKFTFSAREIDDDLIDRIISRVNETNSAFRKDLRVATNVNSELQKLLSHYQNELHQVKKDLGEAITIIDFYGEGINWQCVTEINGNIPINQDREDIYSVPGMKAREFLSKIKDRSPK